MYLLYTCVVDKSGGSKHLKCRGKFIMLKSVIKKNTFVCVFLLFTFSICLAFKNKNVIDLRLSTSAFIAADSNPQSLHLMASHCSLGSYKNRRPC